MDVSGLLEVTFSFPTVERSIVSDVPSEIKYTLGSPEGKKLACEYIHLGILTVALVAFHCKYLMIMDVRYIDNKRVWF
jgi:hypothetical protein